MKLPNDPAREITVHSDRNAKPTKYGVGFVSKIVPSRQFGFISYNISTSKKVTQYNKSNPT